MKFESAAARRQWHIEQARARQEYDAREREKVRQWQAPGSCRCPDPRSDWEFNGQESVPTPQALALLPLMQTLNLFGLPGQVAKAVVIIGLQSVVKK